MGYFVEKSGKTVEEAVQAAISELEVDRDSVEVEVLNDQSKGGILGFIKNKEVKVRVKLKDFSSEIAEEFLSDVLSNIGIQADLNINETDEAISINITSDSGALIIGRRGETLDALQYLTSLAVNRYCDEYRRILLDTENYRKKREAVLNRLALGTARKVIEYGKNVTLEPMNPYERRIIHYSLQSNEEIKTYSVGIEPNRKVIISLK